MACEQTAKLPGLVSYCRSRRVRCEQRCTQE